MFTILNGYLDMLRVSNGNRVSSFCAYSVPLPLNRKGIDTTFVSDLKVVEVLGVFSPDPVAVAKRTRVAEVCEIVCVCVFKFVCYT